MIFDFQNLFNYNQKKVRDFKMSKRKKILISNLYLVLVSGRPGSFRAEPISDQAALGTDQDGAGYSGISPKTAWAISSRSESSPV